MILWKVILFILICFVLLVGVVGLVRSIAQGDYIACIACGVLIIACIWALIGIFDSTNKP